MFKITRICGAVFAALSLSSVFAFDAFKVEKIEYQGLDHIDSASIAKEVSVKPGEMFTEAASNQLIQSLYRTGYFANIQLSHRQSTLIIQVQEREAIASVDIQGNQEISTDILKNVLTQAGFTVGNLFDPSTLENVVHSLEQAYYDRGKYAVRVDAKVEPLSGHRVGIKLDISEGLFAKIQHINFVGNHAFSSKELAGEISLSTPTLFSIFNHKDRYTNEAMDQSIRQLTDFYMNHGYPKFHVSGREVSISPDKKSIYLNFDLSEGQIYHFAQPEIVGETILPLSTMQGFMSISAGDLFSKEKIMSAVSAMQSALADRGYAFAHVNPMPTFDEKAKTVKMTFYVDPGKLQYFRHIRFEGNNTAADQVLRQRVSVQEQSKYDQDAIKNSVRRIERQPYIQSIDPEITAVPGTDDLIDETFHVKEISANKVGATFGYSQLDKMIVGGYLTMPDVFGSGNTFSTNLQLSKPAQSLNFSLDQPYFTQNGIEQSISLYMNRVDYSDRNLANYTTNSVGGNIGYAIPFTLDSYFHIGLGYDNTHLLEGSDQTSATTNDFVNQHGSVYNSYILSLGLSRDTTNNAYFPTDGSFLSGTVKATIPGSSLEWYQILTRADWYQPLWGRYYSLGLHGKVNYGNGYGSLDRLPFFQNFYSGGWSTVRGYAESTMGPDDRLTCNAGATSCTPGTVSAGNPIGGNLLVAGSLNFYFPIPFVKPSDTYRMGVFFDGGNVYNTKVVSTAYNGDAFPKYPNFSNLRYSVGLSFEWRIPMLGLIGLSLAKDLNAQSGDDTRIFNFTIGQTF